MRELPRALMLYAAGFGTRMGPLTADRPKPLIEVAGRALIDHALALTGDRQLKIVVNTHYRAGQMATHLAGRNLTLLHEPEILETGGGLRNALPVLGEGPVFTLNTDAVWTGPNPLDTLAAAWDPEKMDALLLLVPKARAAGHNGKGDFLTDAEGRLSRGPGAVYTGAQIIDPTLSRQIPEEKFSTNLIWDAAAARGRLYGVLHHGGWCDVGRPDSIPLAEEMLRGDAHV